MSVFQLNNGYPLSTHEVKDFASDLSLYSIPYQECGHWLEVGDCELRNNFTLYISVLSQQAQSLLHQVIPVLKTYGVSFRLLKNDKLVDQSNGLSLGIKEAGKVIVIYPAHAKQAIKLARELEAVTDSFLGITPYDSLRIGKVLYTELDTGISYHIPAKYRNSRRKGIIGKYYVPIKLLRFNPKGDIYLGVNIKQFSFTHCIIKQAKAASYIDRYGRESAHKLFWQKTVLEQIQHELPVPQVIDFCNKGEDHFLVTGYINGQSLPDRLKGINKDRIWRELELADKVKILGYFLQIAEIIKRLHELGYLHRDIQVNNFIIREDKVYLLDFELAYYMPAGTPDPPFGYGTIMFMSPQQRRCEQPAPEDDIYSMGVVLAYMILNPVDQESFSGNIYNALVNAGLEIALLEVITNCLDPAPANRPSLSSIITLLKTGIIPEKIELV
ncbi:serine/threonine protein kinase [Chitinophaga sancti]|uniref:Protein kinase n=1 Tax=Chitinophaga sancti TaxID=1004 RepID=A0A1K1S705_9BACT|nr:protein kinase [Chitinophaga sancti]WQD62234.1 protein kinase [Chitinophaga sancti]WQG92197.1 protein kinase [Chitinophaga sancti]SFW79797.1 Serine/threonine protein kinase [Chitinophaga sancti]